jgi:immunity protein, SdpI family
MRRWLPVSIIAGAWIFSLAVYSRLPDEIPVHWGMSGEPNRYGSRIEGAFLLPALMLAFYALMQWYPSRDPRAANIAKFRAAYDTVVTATIAFLTGVHVLALASALGWEVDMTTVVFVGLGVLFILLGNLLPRVRSNFIFGIRTPWTLSSESVWTRAHRVGGYAMVVAGILTVVGAFFARPIGITVALASGLLSALIPIVYSYVLWSRDRGGPTNEAS